jgi:hypothetical protein
MPEFYIYKTTTPKTLVAVVGGLHPQLKVAYTNPANYVVFENVQAGANNSTSGFRLGALPNDGGAVDGDGLPLAKIPSQTHYVVLNNASAGATSVNLSAGDGKIDVVPQGSIFGTFDSNLVKTTHTVTRVNVSGSTQTLHIDKPVASGLTAGWVVAIMAPTYLSMPKLSFFLYDASSAAIVAVVGGAMTGPGNIFYDAANYSAYCGCNPACVNTDVSGFTVACSGPRAAASVRQVAHH